MVFHAPLLRLLSYSEINPLSWLRELPHLKGIRSTIELATKYRARPSSITSVGNCWSVTEVRYATSFPCCLRPQAPCLPLYVLHPGPSCSVSLLTALPDSPSAASCDPCGHTAAVKGAPLAALVDTGNMTNWRLLACFLHSQSCRCRHGPIAHQVHPRYPRTPPCGHALLVLRRSPLSVHCGLPACPQCPQGVKDEVHQPPAATHADKCMYGFTGLQFRQVVGLASAWIRQNTVRGSIMTACLSPHSRSPLPIACVHPAHRRASR